MENPIKISNKHSNVIVWSAIILGLSAVGYGLYKYFKPSAVESDLNKLKSEGKVPTLNESQAEAYADSLASGVLKLSVPGDSRLKAGAMVTANLLNKNEFTTPQSLDNFLSGDFLITALRHKISSPGERPRYTCSLECMKGGYQNSVNEAG